MIRYRVWIDEGAEWPKDHVPEHDWIFTAESHDDAARKAAADMHNKGRYGARGDLEFIVQDEHDQWRTVHLRPVVEWKVENTQAVTLAELRGDEPTKEQP